MEYFNPDFLNSLSHYHYFVIKHPFGFWEEWTPRYEFKTLIEGGSSIVTMIRDPRDVATSHHDAYDDIEYFWRDLSWIRTAREILNWRSHERVCVVEYENLVVNTMDHLRNIATMLNEEIVIGHEEFYKDVSLNAQKDKDFVRPWESLNGIRPIDRNSVGRWKDPKYFDYLRKEMTPEIRELAIQLGYTEDWDLLFKEI
jgi:hypothetical protein